MATEYKLSYTGDEINEKLGKIDSLAEKSEIPSKISELTNDIGVIRNSEVSYFGMRYADATKVIDLSDSVKMYLFATPSGYDAEVTGVGAIPNQTYIDANYTEVHTDNRLYLAERINRLHIGERVTSIGDYFMYRAYNLQSLTFANSTAITHLGTRAFALTSICGKYDFTGVTDTKLDAPFTQCLKLEGLTFNNTVTEIAEKTFQGCIALKTVNGISSATTIGNAAFEYCTSLESIDVNPENVTLGDWVFMITPVDAKAGNTILSVAEWKAQGNLCFVPNEWTAEQLEAIRAVKGESVQMPIPESDNQSTEFYYHWGLFPYIQNGKYKGKTLPAAGCCGIYTLYHIYNILHPNAQYDTFYDWMMREVVPRKIKVTQSLCDTLNNCEYGQLLIAGNTDVSYDVGSEITARDLPMALDANAETWGEEGTSFWGVCTALGWTGTEMLFESGKDSGANVKQVILDSLIANKPVMMEIVGAGKHGNISGHGMHAVVPIGYDAETDRLLIIDSANGFNTDIIPFAYWCKFESLITPHEASAIWTFDFGEVIAMTDIDNKLDTLLSAVNSGFHSASGTVTIGDIKGASANTMISYTIPCPPNAKIVMFEADEDTTAAIQRTSNWYYCMSLHCNFADKFSGAANDRNSFATIWAKTAATYGGGVATMGENGCTVQIYSLLAGTYRWKAYYWNE